jgi:hypothetical protein
MQQKIVLRFCNNNQNTIIIWAIFKNSGGEIELATTVNMAFDEFMKDKVNLDPCKIKTARNSRDWLKDQIHKFSSHEGFPALYNDIDIYFGSFARRTKIREIDDIDIMIGLNAQGSTYIDTNGLVEITVNDNADDLLALCHDNTKKLNSRKVINKFINKLSSVPQYEKAQINRNQEAATLMLNSYTWNFDIVPCFFTKPEYDGRTYYLIPDGSGNWKKTDPRIDRDRVSTINQKHNGKVLNVIRIMKYWNKRPTMPTMGSYLLECMILNRYETKDSCSDYIDFEIRDVLSYIRNAVLGVVQDPKNTQGNLNTLSYDDKVKISNRAFEDYNKSVEAWEKEKSGDHKGAMSKWKEIFGGNFPDYTG